jgi:hypothetical protein
MEHLRFLKRLYMNSAKECLMGKYWIFDRPIELIVDAANCSDLETKFTACIFL